VDGDSAFTSTSHAPGEVTFMSVIDEIGSNAKTAKWLGILLVVAGFLSLMAPLVSGLSIAMMIGFLLLVSGVAHLVFVFRAGSFGKGVVMVVLGVLNLIAGLVVVAQPGLALVTLTLFLAAYFAATGVTEIVAAFQARPAQGWGWLAFGGVLSLALGIMIWRQLPLSGAWAVGVLVGVRMLSSGWALFALGGAAARSAGAAEAAESA